MKNTNQTIDHTNLNPQAQKEDILKLCKEAKESNFAGVCVHPHWVSLVAKELKGSAVECITVVGFPLGQNTTEAKIFETQNAIENGATEIDMVINNSWVKEANWEQIEHEISLLKMICQKRVLKVIIETCYLTSEEIQRAALACKNAQADYVKTSTGFGTRGASLVDIENIRKAIGNSLKIKASGGIRDLETAQKYLDLGVDRIGTSSGLIICD